MSFDFLIEMAWKSALICAVALGLVAVLRSRAAADRAAVLRVAVSLLLLLPLLSLFMPRLEIEAWAAEAAPLLPAMPAVAASAGEAASVALLAPLPEAAVAQPTIWDDPSLLFLLLYLGGVAMAAARLGAGLWTLRRWTLGSRRVMCRQWVDAFERARWAAGAPDNLKLLVSDEAPSPMSWGLFRPVILIDRDTLGEPEDADAILAHEIAHVVRRDWLVLMLTRIAAGLFWFNPLVWLLEREVVQQAEEAADIEAALWVEPARYAQTLVHWAQFNAGAAIPANSIAPSAQALARRVRAILDARLRSTPSGSGWTLAAIVGCSVFAITVAVLQLIPAVAEARTALAERSHRAAPAVPNPAAPPLAPDAAAAPDRPAALVVTANAAPDASEAPVRVAALTAAHPHPDAPPPPPPVPGAEPRPWSTPPTPPRVRAPPIAPVARAGARAERTAARVRADGRVDVDTLVAMRIHGVNAAYIRGLAAADAALARVDAEQLIAMRIHGVTPDYVRSLAAAGHRNLSPDQLVAMRIHGVRANAESRTRERARDRSRTETEHDED